MCRNVHSFSKPPVQCRSDTAVEIAHAALALRVKEPMPHSRCTNSAYQQHTLLCSPANTPNCCRCTHSASTRCGGFLGCVNVTVRTQLPELPSPSTCSNTFLPRDCSKLWSCSTPQHTQQAHSSTHAY